MSNHDTECAPMFTFAFASEADQDTLERNKHLTREHWFCWGMERIDERLAELLLYPKRTEAQHRTAMANLRKARQKTWGSEVQAARAAERWRKVPREERIAHCRRMRESQRRAS